MQLQLMKLLGIILLLAGLLVALVSGAGAETAQTWYLTADGKPADAPLAEDEKTHYKDNLLHKDEATTTGHYFDLPYDEVAWFYADTGAECDLSFGEYAWKAYIRTEAIEDDEVGHTLKVEICKVTPGGTVTVLAEGSKTFSGAVDPGVREITCEDIVDTTQNFSTGDWLGIRISWTCPTDRLRIYYGTPADKEDSTIISPSTDPGYPVPELPTIILVFLGLLLLGGYIWLKRWRKSVGAGYASPLS